MQLLITGASGSMGQLLAPKARVLTCRMESTVQQFETEIRSLRSGPTCLIHMAAMTSVDQCEADPRKCFEINTNGSLRLFQAAQNAGIERFIFVSTAHVYAPSSQRLTTAAPTAPVSMYPRSKLLAEVIMRSHVVNTQLSIARVFSLIGPTLKPGFLYPELVARAQRQDYSPLKGYHNVRDFIDVAEVVRRLEILASTSSFPEIVNICSGVPCTVGELAQKVFSAAGLDPSKIIPEAGRPTDSNFLVGVPTELGE